MAANYTTIFVPIAELQKRNRTSPKAQAIAKYFIDNDLLRIDKTIRYDDVADALGTDPRNLKRLIDKYPGFVRLAGTSRYFYLEEFAEIAHTLGMFYPVELPLNVQHSTKIPMIVPQPQHLISPVAVKLTVDGIPTEMVGSNGAPQGSSTDAGISAGELPRRGNGSGHSHGETHSGSSEGLQHGTPLQDVSGVVLQGSRKNSESLPQSIQGNAGQGNPGDQEGRRQADVGETSRDAVGRNPLRRCSTARDFTWFVHSDLGYSEVEVYGTFQPVSSDGQKISNGALAEELLSLANKVAENLRTPDAQTREERIQDLAALTVYANTILHHTIPKE